MEFTIYTAAFSIMLVSLSGVLFVSHFARRLLEQNISYLVSFAAGIFLVTASGLVLEAVQLLDSMLLTILIALVGYGVAWGLHRLMPETHHHHDESCHRSHGGARRLLIGDGIHNVADGLMLVPAFLVSTSLGTVVTVSVLIHEMLQEVSEFFVLKESGYSTKKALIVNFLVSGTILIGVGAGMVLSSTTTITAVLLALSSGFFAHVVLHDLLPTKRVQQSQSAILPHLLLVAFGVIAMGTVSAYLHEWHSHGDELAPGSGQPADVNDALR